MKNRLKLALGIIIAFSIILFIIVKALSLFKEEAENNYIKISKLNAKAFSKELNQDLSNIEQIINNIHSIIDISMPLTSINRRLVDMQKLSTN